MELAPIDFLPCLTSVILDSASKYTAHLITVYRMSPQHFRLDLWSTKTVVQDSGPESYTWRPFY